MKIYIEGKNISNEQLTKWKRKRIKKTFRILGHKEPQIKDTDELVKKLTELKMRYSYNEMYDKLKSKLSLGEMIMRLCFAFSGKRRKFSKTDFHLDGITAEDILREFDNLMLKQSPENDLVNLSACPDHYVLRPIGENGQEVIEFTGNSPFPVQFFIVYGDETGLKTPRDNSYQYQSAGVARTKDGTVIGGVRHQFKNTNKGVEVRASVEFPALCPNSLIKSHQMHLACEFSYWLQWIKNQKN
ncbi:hypothetical protein [Bacillus wiedmannii]|uniref:Group-specific protein n=1 Tax=Bacillus wiedmannii TaxID=1890302 RepID=A0ABX5DYB2_9BACI|nr:hypothetical protein [Bacillus wiedmannii]PRT04433.1 hypothetical protein C6356_15055 [Bacillus wiedmannii]PRT40208.1 hypothetical protein C6357_16465 [Bacillus wiedmannii]